LILGRSKFSLGTLGAMKHTLAFAHSLKVALIVGGLLLLLTFCVPVVFYLGSFSGDAMQTVLDIFWAPLQLLIHVISRLCSHDLRSYVNLFYAAPFVNAVMGALVSFGVCHYLRIRSRKDSHNA
jgi:hypothetical protein